MENTPICKCDEATGGFIIKLIFVIYFYFSINSSISVLQAIVCFLLNISRIIQPYQYISFV